LHAINYAREQIQQPGLHKETLAAMLFGAEILFKVKKKEIIFLPVKQTFCRQ
jgi:hypothetical protein